MGAVDRRCALRGTAAVVLAAAVPRASSSSTATGPTYLVPGYEPDEAYARGGPLQDDPRAARAIPDRYDGAVTLLSAINPANDRVERVLLPLAGHGIAVRPDRSEAVFASMHGAELIAFDPATLDTAPPAAPHAPGYVFGGHAVYAPDDGVLWATERRDPTLPFTGDPAAHEGRVSVRDPHTLAAIGAYPCGGIGPHDMALTADGGHLVIANYGSTIWPDGQQPPVAGIPYGIEPCITVLEAASGKLVARLALKDRKRELRHVAAASLDHIVGLEVRVTSFDDAQRQFARAEGVYQPDPSEREGLGYLPVPMVVWNAEVDSETAKEVTADDPLAMNRGQSVIYDPVHGEGIATFTTSNTVAVVGGDGTLRRLIATDRLGLRWPRGIAMLPDGQHYAVAGDWENIFVFRRGTHDLVRELCRYDLIFGHSHLAVA